MRSSPSPTPKPAQPLALVVALGLAAAVLGVGAALVFGEWRYVVVGVVVALLTSIVDATRPRSAR